MGWLRRVWTRVQRKPSTRPPWVSPKFLGLGALLAAAAVGLTFLVQSGTTPGQDGALHHEYVGFETKEDLLAAVARMPARCDAACVLDQEWNAWLVEPPGKNILEREPVYDDGLLVGYRVVYEYS